MRRITLNFIWEQPGWYEFDWDARRLAQILMGVSWEQGHLLGQLEHLDLQHQSETQLQVLTDDVLNSSEIEGEVLPADQVRSSVARRLGLNVGGSVPSDRNVDGVVEMMTDASVNFRMKLTPERLFAWHAALFPTGYSGMSRIAVGRWRDDKEGPMQVVSGGIGREKIHYQAPPAESVPAEMERFLRWFESGDESNGVVRAGIAHLWFVTIHPFDDGNGRIARSIADMELSRSEKEGKRFYSMSRQIREERKHYYQILERTQRGWVGVTDWLEWFLGCLHRSILASNTTVESVLVRSRFWQRFAKEPFNERQIKVLTKLLEDFEGKLTSSKWAKMTRCSQDTALRDIKDLVDRGALTQDPSGGRSTSYSLAADVNGGAKLRIFD